ncbi:MAG: glycoside hydrolase family 2 TIM barrel-domain containing protein, partial [Bacteroidota bacterium]|nr:glycoside hydrolase family 2 TIM barrel-domain containing protein [Bacteroidota bacterium]
MKKLFLLLLILCISLIGFSQKVEIRKDGNRWKLLENNQPLFVKGVVGHTYLEKVKQYGGNSIRIGSKKEELDQVRQLGLNALVNLPANAERYGFDYNDTAAIRKQTEKIVEIVKNTKDHPAVLMWAIGNELDYIPGTKPFNPKMWDAVNEAAKAIKAIDPNHPVMTVIGTSMMEKVADIVKRCPDIDLLGINSYGDIYTLPETLKKYGWTKPYVISEWGPDGYWEVKRTKWGAPYEQTGREKYTCYEKKYQAAIDNGNGQCLGSYVFYWSGFKQETTHTWFCMFNIDGLESPLIGLMHQMWTGKKLNNAAPIV